MIAMTIKVVIVDTLQSEIMSCGRITAAIAEVEVRIKRGYDENTSRKCAAAVVKENHATCHQGL
jgi:hypothetical protein